ncbi:nitroreductase family protein [Ralstonia nicotianae]
MSMPRQTRDDYRHFQAVTTRWMDNDIYGHVNNVVYYSDFDTVVNAYLIGQGVLDPTVGETIGLVVESQCNYFAPLSFPDRVTAGLRVARLGRTSVRYERSACSATRRARRPRKGISSTSMWTGRRAGRCRCRPRCAPRSSRLSPTSPPDCPVMNDRHPSPDEVERVDRAVTSRRSIRAFLPRPMARADIDAILDVARRAPSGSNTQPWRVYVLTGESKARLSEAIGEAYDQPDADTLHREEYPYYPRTWVDPYQSRRRKVGWDLYGLLGIGRAEKARMRAQHARNFRFFDAPVGLIFAIDRVMEQGSWLDYGMFLEAVMVAARARGIDTCPQAAFTQFHRIIAGQLSMPPEEMVVCGMSMGYADPDAIENTLVTERAPVAEFTRFLE